MWRATAVVRAEAAQTVRGRDARSHEGRRGTWAPVADLRPGWALGPVKERGRVVLILIGEEVTFN